MVALALFAAGGSAISAEAKIGLVDSQLVMQDSIYGKNVRERMKKDFAAREDAIISKERDLRSKFEALERDRDVISEAERNKREKELTKLQQSLQTEGDAFQQDVMQRHEKEAAAFEKVLSEVLAKIAKEENLDLILQQRVTLYSGGKVAYTYKCLQALDQSSKDTAKK